MDFQPIVEVVLQQGIWCALFVWLFYTNKKETTAREERLNSIVDEQKDTLKEISNSLILLNERIEKVEEKILGNN